MYKSKISPDNGEPTTNLWTYRMQQFEHQLEELNLVQQRGSSLLTGPGNQQPEFVSQQNHTF